MNNLEFFSHVVSADFDILAALLTRTKTGGQKECSLLKERDYQCYAPDHHQYPELLAKECLNQTGFSSYEELLAAVAAPFSLRGQNPAQTEHALVWKIMAKACEKYTEEEYIRFALELRIQPQTYTFEGIKQAVEAKYSENEKLPMYKIALCINAMVLGYFAENPCLHSAPYASSLLELRSTEFFSKVKIFHHAGLQQFSEKEIFNLALVLAIIALRTKDEVFYGRSGDSKAELIRKLKRFTALLKTVPEFACNKSKPEIMEEVFAFNVVYLGRYNMPLPKEMACEMLFGKMFAALSESEQKAILRAEKTNLGKDSRALEEITQKLLALGLTKDQMQDLIGVLALSNNRLIKIENIFIEWAVKLGLR